VNDDSRAKKIEAQLFCFHFQIKLISYLGENDGSQSLIHSTAPNPVFYIREKAPLSINPEHAPGLAGESYGSYRASPAVFCTAYSNLHPALIRFANEDRKARRPGRSRRGLFKESFFA